MVLDWCKLTIKNIFVAHVITECVCSDLANNLFLGYEYKILVECSKYLDTLNSRCGILCVMSISNEFLEYILDMLSPIGDIRTSRMFGGVLLKVDGVQLGVLFSETMYFKVTDINMQKRYKQMGSTQFTYTRQDKKDPVIIKNWWTVPESAMDNSEEMVKLAENVLSQKCSTT